MDVRCALRRISVIISVCLLPFSLVEANAQNITLPTIAMKSGETSDLMNLYYVVNCKSLLTGPVTAEILRGPPEISVTVREASVVPRRQGCTRPIRGGTLVLTAKNIEEPLTTTLTIRVTYNTKDGPRKSAMEYNLSLIP